MKNLSQLVVGLICAGLCAGICAAQTPPAGSTAPATSETESTVQGKVVQEPGGQGIRKVNVSLRGLSQYGATTDETGQFTIEGVAPGTYMVELARSGFAPDQKSNRDRQIKVVAGQDMKELVFHMQVAGVILGKIVDLDGDPLRNVNVIAIRSSGGAARWNVGRSGAGFTNDLGEYRIADLPPGKYVVHATPAEDQATLPSPEEKGTTRERLAYVTTYFPGTLDERQASVVVVPAGGTATADFGVQASRVYRVSGSVVGLSSQPVTQDTTNDIAGVLARQTPGRIFLVGKNGQRKEENLGENGKFEFTGVLPGTYRAQLISFSGFFSGQPPSIKMQTIRTPIEVSGADVTGLQLQIEAGGDVSGKFRVEGDEKIDWKQLYVGLVAVPKSEEEQPELGIVMPMGNAALTEDGSFEIKDVPAGDCQLAVGAHSGKFRDYYTKSVLLGGREVADTGFAASPGTVLDVVVSAKGAGIEGTVADAAGKPVADATVVSVPSSGKLGRPDAYQSGRTDESGHFVLRGMNPGEFLVLAFDEIPANYRTAEFARKYEGKGEKVELQEGGRKSVALKLIMEEDEKP